MRFRKITYFILILAITGCSNDSPDDLGITPVKSGDEITYTGNVKTIIDNNCIICHASVPINGAPMSLTSLEDVKNAIELRHLIERISRDDGQSGQMPLGGPKMPQQNIDVITLWRDQGFKL